MSVPDPSPVLDLIEAFRRSKVMFAAVALGVFDALAHGPASSGTLAAQLGADESALTRLLDTCVALQLLQRKDGQYSNTATARTYLTKRSPETLTGYIQYSNAALYPLWGDLVNAVREGMHRWTKVFGPEASLFSHFFRTEDAKREFLLGMHGFGRLSSPAVVEAFDLSGFRTLVDLGGATGHLALAACERYPEMRAVVFDLPAALPMAAEQRAASAVRERVELTAGDFFMDALPAGDLYALGRILHDWTESKIELLLRRIYDALPAGGALLIAERLLDDDKLGPLSAQLQSLNMLVCTEGRERSLPEYRALLEQAGFSRIEGRRTGTPLDAILAIKASDIQ